MRRWALLGGAKGSPRSALAQQAAERLARQGVRVAGFVQRSERIGRDVQAIELVRLGSADTLALAKAGRAPRPNEEEFCSFAFDTRAFARARAWVEEDAPGADLVVLDEIAKLEAAGRGHHDAVALALSAAVGAPVVLSIRADQLYAVIDRFSLSDEPFATLEAPADEAALAAFVEALRANALQKR